MKRAIAAVVAGFLGMGGGVIVWTAVAVVALLIYWVGFVFIYCGIVCGQPGGRGLGLGLCDPPDNLAEISGVVIICTAVAFTWGEVFAGLLGAAVGVATALGLIRLFSPAFKRHDS